MIEALRAVKKSEPRYASIAVQEMSCLFACSDHCTAHLRAPDKIGYVMGRFAPSEVTARAILDYAVLYAASKHGQVPYSQWPEGIKGHFITRTPPPGYVARSEEHTSELHSLMRISYAVFCLKKKTK